jgi:hypothetical protein
MVCRGLTRPRLSDGPIQGRYVEVVKLNKRKWLVRLSQNGSRGGSSALQLRVRDPHASRLAAGKWVPTHATTVRLSCDDLLSGAF